VNTSFASFSENSFIQVVSAQKRYCGWMTFMIDFHQRHGFQVIEFHLIQFLLPARLSPKGRETNAVHRRLGWWCPWSLE